MTFFRKKLFPALAGLLWALFLALDLTGWADSTGVKFAAICLCALTAWTGAKGRDGLLVAAALTLTVCADVFLLVLNRTVADRAIGVCLFLPVQLLYAWRLYRLRRGAACRWGLTLRLLGLLGALAAAPLEPLSALAAFYFLNLAVNTLEAFSLLTAPSLLRLPDADPSLRQCPQGADPLPALRRFAWGLLLFVGCDLCVGAWNLGLWGDFARIGMWLFYLPSQVLIVLSQDTKGELP